MEDTGSSPCQQPLVPMAPKKVNSTINLFGSKASRKLVKEDFCTGSLLPDFLAIAECRQSNDSGLPPISSSHGPTPLTLTYGRKLPEWPAPSSNLELNLSEEMSQKIGTKSLPPLKQESSKKSLQISWYAITHPSKG